MLRFGSDEGSASSNIHLRKSFLYKKGLNNNENQFPFRQTTSRRRPVIHRLLRLKERRTQKAHLPKRRRVLPLGRHLSLRLPEPRETLPRRLPHRPRLLRGRRHQLRRHRLAHQPLLKRIRLLGSDRRRRSHLRPRHLLSRRMKECENS